MPKFPPKKYSKRAAPPPEPTVIEKRRPGYWRGTNAFERFHLRTKKYQQRLRDLRRSHIALTRLERRATDMMPDQPPALTGHEAPPPPPPALAPPEPELWRDDFYEQRDPFWVDDKWNWMPYMYETRLADINDRQQLLLSGFADQSRLPPPLTEQKLADYQHDLNRARAKAEKAEAKERLAAQKPSGPAARPKHGRTKFGYSTAVLGKGAEEDSE